MTRPPGGLTGRKLALLSFALVAGLVAGGALAEDVPPLPALAVTLSRQPAAEYRTGEPTSAGHATIAAEAARRFPGLRFSSNLARAARELAGSWTGRDLAEAPHELLTFVLHGSGSPDASALAALVMTTVEGPSPVWPELAAAVTSSPEGFTDVGIGQAADPDRPRYTRWVILLVARQFSLEPLPRAVAADEAVRMRFALDRGLRDPEVITITPHGATRRAAARPAGAGWEVVLPLGNEPGEHGVEILADDEHGPHVLALFPISIGVPPPRRWQGQPPPAEDDIHTVGEAERYVRDLTDRQRSENGRKELTWDPRLAVLARQHSEDMRDHGFMGHLSPTTGDIGDRLRRAEYPFKFAAENIARSNSLWEAVESLMRSPGHRRNLLATEATHAGIGVAIAADADGKRTFYVTQEFVRPASPAIHHR